MSVVGILPAMKESILQHLTLVEIKSEGQCFRANNNYVEYHLQRECVWQASFLERIYSQRLVQSMPIILLSNQRALENVGQ